MYNNLLFEKEKTKNDFFLFKVCLTSILQNSYYVTLSHIATRDRPKGQHGQNQIPQ
jgi:hypothetical protein